MYAKFPIAIWKDNEGIFSVSTISGTFACARGIDLKKCTEDLKKFIAWRLRNSRFLEPEFSEPKYETVEVFVRTEHESDQRRYPASEPIRFSLPYVWGELADSSICCCFPTLHASFYCYDQREMKQLVRSQAESHLMGCSPNALITTLPPLDFQTATINVKLPKPKNEDEEIQFPSLESVATSLTSRANRKLFSRNWLRESQTSRLCQRLGASSGNIMLVGNKGVGKTTLLVNAARELVRISRAKKQTEDEELPDTRYERFWLTSADRLVAGMQYLGQWEERAELVIDELSEIQGVLCFESLEPLLRLGGRDAVDSLAAFFIPYLQNQELRVVVEATPEELDASRRLLPNFESMFQIVKVEPMDNLQARQVLLNIAQQYQRDHKVGFEQESAELCGQLFRRFLPYETFPGNCVRFWSSLFENASRNRAHQVTRNDVVDQFIRKTGLPEPLIRDDFRLPSSEIEEYFTGRVIGQDVACHSLTRVVTTFKAGLNDPQRPIGVQLFCGPTGVGKTELSKALADYLFGAGDAKDRLVRLDMSEYGGPLAAERLIMQSDGQPSEFIKRIREQPLVIVLLDEIEKASHEVFDVLMGMFDEGRLTDRWGRTTDFRSTVVIMTSNLGVRAGESLGFEPTDHDDFETEVQKFFRPEFFNRIDRLIAFQPLSRESISKIATLELEKIRKREGLVKRKLILEWSDEVLALVTEQGYDAKFGARPLQRTIEQLIVAPLARLLAENPDLRETKLTCKVQDDAVQLDLGT